MEPLILYFVLFFPGVFSNGISVDISSTGTIPFSAIRELGRTLTYTIPSLALLWYLVFRVQDRKELKAQDLFPAIKKPGKRDFFAFIIGIPGLILIGIVISCLISFLSNYQGLALPLKVEAPVGILGWAVMVFSCIGTGYLEEGYFRYYLTIKLESSLSSPVLRTMLSTVLFSLCHIYEGPWGILNAVLAGLLLSVLFIRFRALHGIAWAHSAYNVFVYIMGTVNS